MAQELIPFGQKTGAVSAVFADIFKGVATLEKKFVEKFPLLSFKGGKFHGIVQGDMNTFKDEEGVPVNRLDVVVVGIPHGRSQVLFPKYDPDNPAAPLCSSINGRTPDADVKQPFSTNCQTCEKRIKVRGEDGKERAPCQQVMNLAVVVQGQPEHIYKTKLAVTAIYDKQSENADYKAWDQYMDHLRKNGVIHPAQVVTRISFDPNAQYPRPLFKAIGHLTDEQVIALEPVIKSPVTLEIVNGSPEQVGNGQEHQQIAAPAETPKQIAAPVETPKPVEEPKQQVHEESKQESEAEMRARIEAEVKARIEAEIKGKAETKAEAPVKESKPKKEKAAPVVVETDAELEAALGDW